MENQNSFFQSVFQSATAKVSMVGILTLVLLIPLSFVQELISERAERKKEVITEITSKWGESVLLYGPIIKVPYLVHTPIANTADFTTETNYAYFFPDELDSKINVKTTEKQRNNYDAVVFSSEMKFKGNFSMPSFSRESISPENIRWDKSTIIINTSNLKSIKDGMKINFAGKTLEFNTAESNNSLLSQLQTEPINLFEYFSDNKATFNFDVSYNGSQQLMLVPIAKTNSANIKSNWTSPKFSGYFLPNGDEKKTNANGFEANWKILEFNRPFAQSYFGVLPNLEKYAFGVDFIISVDEYQKNERASKYGFLVIGLTFLIFFVIQSISKISIHIFNYTMIGLALIMFYTLLISITEHSNFLKAYVIAGISVVVMISLYSISLLKNRKFPLLIAFSLTVLYTFIFVIIQLENYALLVGSIGLFLILGLIMYFSRKIDWNNLKN